MERKLRVSPPETWSKTVLDWWKDQHKGALDFLITDWTISVDETWSPTVLDFFRNAPLDFMAEELNKNHELKRASALYEIMMHGNFRRAAELSRLLVEKDPTNELLIKKKFGDEFGDVLLKEELDEIPCVNL